MLIDTHCHLHDREFFAPDQAEAALAEAAAGGVGKVVVIGTDPADSDAARTFSAAHDNVYWTYGIHPENAGSGAADASLLDADNQAGAGPNAAKPHEESATVSKRLASAKALRLVAIGEIGLDYHYGDNKTAQKQLFNQMLQIAKDLNLPVSLHIREAFADAFPILDNFPGITGVVHSFTGSKKELKGALSRGFYIGVNGLATYSTLPMPPLDRILLETDAPFLTPVPFRGTMNKPGYVRYVASYLSQALGVEETLIAEQTTKNAERLFHF